MIVGETILVNGNPVDNVLVEPGSKQEIATNAKLPLGTVIAYTLRFPIAYEGPLYDSTVTVRGEECETFGFADHYRPAERFGSWAGAHDMTVLVTKRLGDLRVNISIVKFSATVDELGDPIETSETIYEGLAQARLSDGSESEGDANAVDVRESWYFVVPWQDLFGELRPTNTRIVVDDAVYDVDLIDNVDMKSQFATFRGVRHD